MFFVVPFHFLFTGLVAGLGLGALAEVTKRQLGLGKEGK